ncbi:MAG TPA: glycosyltransferase family 1 protein [Bacteroidia bacterium]|jgi:hypothetical protein|nr:glycosyltransferase family 1 protein [Bacteroidia bacterium]
MDQKHLHIIAFDVPYPANYGGVIDIYYKIKALHAHGVKIFLHCFEYGRAEALTLESICEKVYYYKRKMNKEQLFLSMPFVVVSRSSEKLMENLLRDKHPILFEGLHSCFHLDDAQLSNRIKIVRTHNIEHDYYKNLAKVERSLFRKMYFGMEARKLSRFEKILHKANYIATISSADAKTLSAHYKNVHHISAFHPNEQVKIKEGKGEFCLYHGNLEVGENNEASLYLVNEIFSKIQVPLIIAGRKPSVELKMAVERHDHIQLKANINTPEIDELISNAQINVLPTFQATGIKLKLLAALFNGRHCVVNSPMVVNTGLESLCSVQNSPEEMAKEIKRLFELSFDMNEMAKRTTILDESFSNNTNVKKLIDLI